MTIDGSSFCSASPGLISPVRSKSAPEYVRPAAHGAAPWGRCEAVGQGYFCTAAVRCGAVEVHPARTIRAAAMVSESLRLIVHLLRSPRAIAAVTLFQPQVYFLRQKYIANLWRSGFDGYNWRLTTRVPPKYRLRFCPSGLTASAATSPHTRATIHRGAGW